jgi:hypothetical protein
MMGRFVADPGTLAHDLDVLAVRVTLAVGSGRARPQYDHSSQAAQQFSTIH